MKDSEPDYYFNDKGLLVFTRSYHLKRGHCCGSGCIHCPYEYSGVKDVQKRKWLMQRFSSLNQNEGSEPA